MRKERSSDPRKEKRLRLMKQSSGTLRKWACAATALAGVTGAGGIILAGVAAHDVPDQRLQTAANFMLLHAAATLVVCGLSFAVPQGGVWFLGPAWVFPCGSLLFGGDLAARRSPEQDCFPWRLRSAEHWLSLGGFWSRWRPWPSCGNLMTGNWLKTLMNN
jgi:uncharacterized membrane protein YgdD (TMEM256/DUF423 family)